MAELTIFGDPRSSLEFILMSLDVPKTNRVQLKSFIRGDRQTSGAVKTAGEKYDRGAWFGHDS